MPRFNFTFQEASPLITYTGIWLEGSQEDPLFQQYNGSFRVTNDTGTQATLIFTGTGVTLFGAMRPNHGDYAVTLDNDPTIHASGTSQANLFQLPLRQTYGLPYQQHTLQITNEPTSANTAYFDLDFVQIERVVGKDNDTIFVSTVDDTSPLVTYVGPWEPSGAMSSLNNNGTIHQTLQSNSSFSITFQGCCIELYGLYANAAFTVIVDGGFPMQMQGQDINIPPAIWHPQTLLYVADGLSENTNHTVSLTTTFATQQRPFFFDYGVLRSTQNSSGPLPPLPIPVSNTSSHQTPAAVIAGASIGGAVLTCLIVAACIMWFRRRRDHTLSQLDSTTESGNSRQPQPGWMPWSRNARDTVGATITAWYPPNEASSQAQNSLDPQISSGAMNSSSPSNTSSNTRSSKSRAGLGGQTVTPAQSATTSASHVRAQSGSGVNGGTSTPSMHLSTSSQRSLPQRSDRESVVGGSPSAPQDQPATTISLIPVREEDAGHLYRDDEGETLPPAYNPGWDPHAS